MEGLDLDLGRPASVLEGDRSLRIADVEEECLDDVRAHLEERMESGISQRITLGFTPFSAAAAEDSAVDLEAIAQTSEISVQPANDNELIVSYAWATGIRRTVSGFFDYCFKAGKDFTALTRIVTDENLKSSKAVYASAVEAVKPVKEGVYTGARTCAKNPELAFAAALMAVMIGAPLISGSSSSSYKFSDQFAGYEAISDESEARLALADFGPYKGFSCSRDMNRAGCRDFKKIYQGMKKRGADLQPRSGYLTANRR